MRITAQILQRADGWHFRWRHITSSGQAIDYVYPDPNGKEQCEEFETILIKFQESVREKIHQLQGDENYDQPKGSTPALKIWWRVDGEGDEPEKDVG